MNNYTGACSAREDRERQTEETGLLRDEQDARWRFRDLAPAPPPVVPSDDSDVPFTFPAATTQPESSHG
jgi:hypothetical protein